MKRERDEEREREGESERERDPGQAKVCRHMYACLHMFKT
jgi:hypothetical protein